MFSYLDTVSMVLVMFLKMCYVVRIRRGARVEDA